LKLEACSLLLAARSPSESKVGQMQLLLHLVTDLEVVARNCNLQPMQYAVCSWKVALPASLLHNILFNQIAKRKLQQAVRRRLAKNFLFFCVSTATSAAALDTSADCFACDKLMNVPQFRGHGH